MKKFAFLSLFLLSSMACATIEKALDSAQTPTPFVLPTVAPEQTAAAVPTQITRREDQDVFCPTDIAEAMAAYNQGVTFENTGDEASAIKSYRQAIELDPNYCDAMDNLAILLRKNGETDEAIRWYQASIAIAPDNEVSHLGLANAYMELEDYDKALAEYNALLDIDLNNPEGYYGAGRVYFAQADYKEAIAQFKKAEDIYIAIDSVYLVDAQTYIGFSYVLLEDYENGRTYLELVYPDMQDNSYVNYYLGQCYYYGKSIRNEPLAKLYLTRARDLGIELEPELEKFVNTP
jgi:tetratricopeptide (TPR) repeat protein